MAAQKQSTFRSIYRTVLGQLSQARDHGTGRLPPDSMLQNRYLIVHPIGRGGMGAVYLAIDTHQRSKVAIKELSLANLNAVQRIDAVNRFKQEAIMLSRLSHHNLPHVYDSFEERDRSYLVMDYIPGITLLEVLKKMGRTLLPIDLVVSIAVQLCDALSYLHQQNPAIIFRDLKPSNVMLTADGHLFLIDFGIARFFKPGQVGDTVAMGTLGYAPPEQHGHSNTDPRSDLYSLGATLHHCLTGFNPASNPFMFVPPSQVNPLVSPELEHLIFQLVNIDPSARPASALNVQQTILRLYPTSTIVSLANFTIGNQPLFPPGLDPNAPLILSVKKSKRFGGHYNPTGGNAVIPLAPLAWQRIFTPMAQSFLMIAALAIALSRYISARYGLQTHSQGLKGLFFFLWRAVSFWPPNVWEQSFIARFILLFCLSVGGSVYISKVMHGSASLVELYLLLFLFFVAVLAGTRTRIQDPVPRSILFLTALAAFLAAFALQALPDMQPSAGAFPHVTTTNQVLTYALILLAFISLLRQSNGSPWIEHLLALAVSAICALLQYSFGAQALEQAFSLPSATALAVSDFLAFIIVIIAIITLVRISASFEQFDAIMLFLVACLFAILQYAFGYAELMQFSASALPHASLAVSPVHHGLLAATLHHKSHAVSTLHAVPTVTPLQQFAIPLVFLTFGPLLIAFIALVDLPTWLGWIKRVAATLIAVVCAALLNFLGNKATLPLLSASLHPLASHPLDISTLYRLLISGTVLALFLLIPRLFAQFNWLDRAMVYIIALTISLLQSAFWQQAQVNSSTSANFDPSLANRQFVLIVSQGIMFLLYALIVLALIALITAAVLRILHLTGQSSILHKFAAFIDRMVAWIDRAIVVAIIAFSLLLQWSLTNIPQQLILLFTQVSAQRGSVNVQEITACAVSLATLGLIISFFILLYRLFSRGDHPFSFWDRFSMCIAAATCLYILLYWNAGSIQRLPLLGSKVQFTGNMLHLAPFPLHLLLAGGFLLLLIISCCWLLLKPQRIERHKLLLLLWPVGACTVLQLFAPLFTFIALILLIQVLLITIQVEETQAGPAPTP